MEANSCLSIFQKWRGAEERLTDSPSAMSCESGSIYISLAAQLLLVVSAYVVFLSCISIWEYKPQMKL